MRGGEIVAGDAFELTAARYAALPEAALGRFLQAVASIPEGRALRYRDVAIAMGVDVSFVRAIPGYIRRNGGAHLPSHRIVDAKGRLPQIVAGQASMLQAEGVSVRDEGGAQVVDLQRFLWQG